MAVPEGGSLQFSIAGAQIRKFKTAVQSLGKIGERAPRMRSVPAGRGAGSQA